MKYLIIISCSLTVLFAKAQDKLNTSVGEVTITPILHGTLALSWNDLTIYVDPYGGAERFDGIADPDLILITDIHGDHLNQSTLDALNTDMSAFVVPQAVAEKLPDSYGNRVTILGNGEETSWKGVNLAAIPMYNLPESEESRHVKGRGNGYILTIGDTKIYLSGDTEDIPEMRNLKGINVAFVCMNLPYTMSVEQAADAVSEFKPGIVYPYHYRGQGGLSDVEQFKTLVNGAAPEVEVRLRNWYKE